ncbi:MAG: hypothetical protein ACFCUW_18270 [Kiloniellaceae bacterium]
MADSDLINDELERVYRLYGERTRQFRRGLYVLVVAGLAVFVLLVVPFLTFRDQLAATQARAADLAVELQEARARVADTGTSLARFEEIRERFEIFKAETTEFAFFEELLREAEAHADELESLRQSFARSPDPGMQAWVRGEARQPPQEIVDTSRHLHGLARDACYWDSGTPRVTCRLCVDFMGAHDAAARQIGSLPAVGAELAGPATADLERQVDRACAWLTAGEPHWRHGERFAALGDPASPDIGFLRGWYNDDLVAYVDRLYGLRAELRRALAERGLEVERLQRALAAAGERLAVLEAQLGRIAGFDRLDTPVGALPLGLGQLVLLFPVALGFGFLVVANAYAGSVELRRAFVRLCRKRDAAGEVMDARHIAAIAPLWLDRAAPLGARAARWAILLVPLALTLANLVLIAATAALTAQLPDDSAIPPAAYLLLYAASLALFAGTLWYVWHCGREGEEEE